MSVYFQDPSLSLMFKRDYHKSVLTIRITGQLMSLHIQDYLKMFTDVPKDYILSTVTQCRDQCSQLYHQVVFACDWIWNPSLFVPKFCPQAKQRLLTKPLILDFAKSLELNLLFDNTSTLGFYIHFPVGSNDCNNSK
jgi:hypothetical protein